MSIAVEGVVPMLLVYDVPTSVAFYRDQLGFDVVHHSASFDEAKDNFGWALLRLNGCELMVNNMYEDNVRPVQPDAVRAKAHSDLTLYLACRDIGGTHAYLKAQGLSVSDPVTTYYKMRQISLKDFDGYSIVFQWPSE